MMATERMRCPALRRSTLRSEPTAGWSNMTPLRSLAGESDPARLSDAKRPHIGSFSFAPSRAGLVRVVQPSERAFANP